MQWLDGKQLRKYRCNQRCSQQELASICNGAVSLASIRRYEQSNEICRVTAKTLDALESALDAKGKLRFEQESPSVCLVRRLSPGTHCFQSLDLLVDNHFTNPIRYLWADPRGGWIKAEIIQSAAKKPLNTLKIQFRSVGFPSNLAINVTDCLDLEPDDDCELYAIKFDIQNASGDRSRSNVRKGAVRQTPVSYSLRVADENDIQWVLAQDYGSPDQVIFKLQNHCDTQTVVLHEMTNWSPFLPPPKFPLSRPRFSRIKYIVLEFGRSGSKTPGDGSGQLCVSNFRIEVRKIEPPNASH